MNDVIFVSAPGPQGPPGIQSAASIGLGNVDNTRDVDKPGPLGARMRPASKVLYPESVTVTFGATIPSYYPASSTAYAWNNATRRMSLQGVATTGNPGAGLYLQNLGTGSNSTGACWMIEYYVFGTQVSHHFSPVANGADVDYKIWVDDQPLTQGWQHAVGASNGFTWLALTFPTSRLRRVRIAISGSLLLGGIVVPTSAANKVYPADSRFKVAMVGDSYVAGNTQVAEGFMTAGGLSNCLAAATGFEVFNMGQSGTGYISDSGGAFSKYGGASRLTALANLPALDLIIVEGGGNDLFYGNSQAATVAAAQAYWATLAVARPSTPVVVVGPIRYMTLANGYTSDAAIINLDNALRAAALAAPNVRGYISQVQEPWITGNGGSAILNGSGNSDVFVGPDGIHPSHDGAEYLARRLTQALMTVKV